MEQPDKNNPKRKILTPTSATMSPVSSSNGNGSIPLAGSNSLAEKDSNYIFFFGKPSIGKSVILASMLYHMNAQAGSIRPKHSTPNTKDAEVLLFDLLHNIKKGILPKRSTVDAVTRIDLVFEPNNTSKKVKPVNLTFLEMSGENLQQVRRGGSFHRSIDEYLNADIPLNFLLVTDYENADEDDSLMFSFLNELEKKNRRYKNANAILIIAKWDKSGSMRIPSPEALDDFILDHMPMTNNQINNYCLYKTYYTVGEVETTDDGEQRLVQLNLATAKMLTEWLYQNITGVDMNHPGNFWQGLFSK